MKKGTKHTIVSKEKLRLKALNQFKNGMPRDTIDKIRRANTGRKVSEETRRKISQSEKGKMLSQETKEKLRQSALRQFKNGFPESTRRKLSIASKRVGNAHLRKYKREKHPRWIDGRDAYRNIALDNGLDLSICQICKKVGRMYVHHINGNRHNNTLKNLSIVCAKCHKAIHQKRRIN